jgi:DNA-binding response OmpR family regulator
MEILGLKVLWMQVQRLFLICLNDTKYFYKGLIFIDSKKILVIEDEVSIAELEKDYLEINGFSVDIENNGKNALEKALSKKYNLIVLDLMLPEIDGFEILKAIRKVSNVPVLLVSAKKEDIDIIRGLGLGADDYVTKPFSPIQLVARVKAHITKYERLLLGVQSQNSTIEIGEIKIDLSSRRVYLNDNEVSFTSKEFDLLCFLAQNPRRVFSKEELLDRIWGFDSYSKVDASTVTVHIKKVRNKIESDISNPKYIETVWGAGYRFKD